MPAKVKTPKLKVSTIRKPGRPRTKPLPGYPMVTARTSRDPEQMTPALAGRDFAFISANFPFSIYDICDSVAMYDPYVRRFIWQTVALGNPGHKIYLQASSEAKARAAVKECNDLSARCFPLSGGTDGLMNCSLEQEARSGATCVEWVPASDFSRIERAFIIPVKTLRWKYLDSQGTLELLQQQPGKAGAGVNGMKSLNPVQTVYHGLNLRDSNPYAIPPILSALESCKMHRDIMTQIRTWVQKASALGVLLASVKAPPRVGGESQEKYDEKSQIYLDKIAKTLAENMLDGLGVGYDNIEFTFHNVQAGAQGAKEILQVALQGLFAALQRDPIWFGWNFGATETYAKVIFQELMQGLQIFQMGALKVLEHGLRLNLALLGMGDITLAAKFDNDQITDVFKAMEAELMKAQAVVSQLESEPPIITVPEARKLLGHDSLDIEAGAYVAALNRDSGQYNIVPFQRRAYPVEMDLSGKGKPAETEEAA